LQGVHFQPDNQFDDSDLPLKIKCPPLLIHFLIANQATKEFDERRKKVLKLLVEPSKAPKDATFFVSKTWLTQNYRNINLPSDAAVKVVRLGSLFARFTAIVLLLSCSFFR